jgi:hypothetical protein
MASSSRRGGAGGKKSVTSRATKQGRPAAKKAAPAGKRPRAKSTTGVIAVKRAGVLPRQSRARAPRPLAPEAGLPLELVAALEVSVATEPAAEPQAIDEAQPYAALEVVAQTETAVADDVTDEMPLAEPEPAAAALPAPPAPVPTAGPTGMSWLMTKLRRLAGLRV